MRIWRRAKDRPKPPQWNRLYPDPKKAAGAETAAETSTGLRRAYQSTSTPPPVSWWVGKSREQLRAEVETRDAQRRGNRE
jgi:hypothetical protein